MSQAIILLENKGKIHFLNENKEVVEVLDESCIMNYTIASELRAKLDYRTNSKLISVKDLILSNKHNIDYLCVEFTV